jgi:hypothetical protein
MSGYLDGAEWRPLLARRAEAGAGEGDRTLVLSLENSCSTIELHPHIPGTHELTFRSVPLQKKRMVGEVGLEPTKP